MKAIVLKRKKKPKNENWEVYKITVPRIIRWWLLPATEWESRNWAWAILPPGLTCQRRWESGSWSYRDIKYALD